MSAQSNPVNDAMDALINNLSTAKLVELIRVSETAERYGDMYKFATKFVQKSNEKLNADERDLINAAFKNFIGPKRSAWKTLAGGFDDATENLVNAHKSIVEQEIISICSEVIQLAANLCKNVEGDGDETEVFFLKMCGDYYRYLCELQPTDFNKTNTENYYQKALDIAEVTLTETNAVRLGLALNFSVFLFEILKNAKRACELANKSFDAALEKLDEMNDRNYKASANIMQLLRDNVTLWGEMADEDELHDGIDIAKYGKYVKATRHNADSEQDMHDMKADMKKLGLMSQNTKDPTNPMDKIRDGLTNLLVEISGDKDGDEGLYGAVIDIILEYEAFIDLSRFKCIECDQYFGCDAFDNLCSGCYETRYDEAKRKQQCKDAMEDIVIRIEWNSGCHRYYNMINMPSLCSLKIMFRILNRTTGWRGERMKNLDVSEYFDLEKVRYLKKDEEVDDSVKEKRKLNARCIADFGINQLTAVLLR